MQDIWADWLLHGRQAGDAALGEAIDKRVDVFADRVLDGVGPFTRLLDVGAGTGAVGFRAIARGGPDVRVVFADMSERLLRHAAARAERLGVAGQCQFVRCGADDLAGLAAEAFDAVVTRSVLAYLPDKAAAVRAMFQVLRPGGRLSVGEPMFREEALRAVALRMVFEARNGADVEPLLPLLCRWQGAQFPDTEAAMETNPLTNFTADDLARHAAAAGFVDVEAELVMHEGRAAAMSWGQFLGCAPHPMAPPLGEIMRTRFSVEEREAFERICRPALRRLTSSGERMVYLRATRPLV
jgi:ubiquinone/menaquinone biosynthesis C-methylase UbiE